MPQSQKPHAPACDRNREPILGVLRRHLPRRGRLLEIGSGTGQHAAYFAAALPDLIWQSSDLGENLPGIRMWIQEAYRANLPEPLLLDVEHHWPQARYDAVFSANTLHIMRWSAVQALFEHLPQVLEQGGCVVVYGPFNYSGRFTSASNAAFDEWLKQRSADMGLRDFEAVDALARSIGLELIEDCAMPANNRTLVWRYRSSG